MSCLAVIDTNVLVSALISSDDGAATVQVLDEVIRGRIIPIYSSEIMQEYNEVLRRKKFGFSERTVAYLVAAIREFGVYLEPAPVDIELPDMADLPFYEAVFEKSCEGAYLITGNIKHFPQEAFIVTARKIIDILNKTRSGSADVAGELS